MNKILTKVTALCVGLAMVAGVGVAIGSKAVSEAKAADVTIDLTAQGFTNQQEVSTVTSGSFTLTFAKATGSNPPKYYTSGSSVRTYANNTLKVETSGDNNITEIAFTLGGTTTATPTANTGTYDSNSKTWTGSAKSITFTNASSGQYHYKTVAITTGGGGGEEDPVLQSIAVSNEVTEYNVGDEFIKPTVTATYDKGDPQDVTSSATCTGYNMGVAGEYTVTVSYGGKTAEYDITVTDPTPVGDLLYSCDFTEVETHSYTQNKEFTLNEKDWVASVSQVNGGVFYLGCNSTHAAKGILNDNTSFADVVTALAAEDTPYGAAVATAHAYAMRFSNAYDNVGSVEFVWAGGNNAFQVYLFGDQGDGLVKLASTNYATSSATTSGNVKWNASGYGESFNEFVVVARPGATGSTATSKTLRAATFKIYEGETEPVDPTKDTLNILLNDSTPSPATVRYSSGGLYYANDKDGNDVNAEWSSSNTSIFTVGKNGNNVCYVTPVAPGTANIIAKADGYNDGIFVLTIDAGAVETVTVSGEMTKTSYSTAESWSPAGLTVTANYEYGYHEDVTSQASWSYNPGAPAENVTSVVATATYSSISGSSPAQAVSVTVSHAGTAADPFTVAEALAKANEIGAVGNTGQGPWVTKGIISRVTSAPAATYWNATYYISDDGTQSNELQVYRGFYLNNAKFDAETALLMKAGMIVTVTGNLTGSYGCEYCQGNYLLSIEEPATGDVDVTFEPASTSFEIGATGTFTASSETSGVTYEWSVDHSDVLSVNSSTGAYEALALGVARVTVTASAGGKEGFAHVDFVVNGSAGSYYTVANANTIASGVESGKTTVYYIYVEGYVKEFATSTSGSSPRAFDIMTLDESASIMVYTNVNPYADFVDGLSLGDRIVVKGKIQNYNGTYEIVEPEKVGSNASAITFALGFISQTDAVCEGYDGVSNNKEALEAIWEGLYTSYNALYDNQKSVLMGAERDEGGTHVEQAVARYDYLVGKYGLNNFITGRTPVSFPAGSYLPSYENNLSSSSSITIIVIVAVASMTLLGVTLVIRKRKMN